MDLTKKIIKESIKIVIAASIISSIGGIGLEALKAKIAVLIPLVIILPALNAMIGDFGTVISSKFTTLLYQHKVPRAWWRSYELGDQFRIIATIALFAALYLAVAASVISFVQGFEITIVDTLKVIAIAFIAVATLVLVIFFISIVGGFWIYKKGSDPNTFLIPVATSIADFSSLILFALLVAFLF